MTPTLETIQQDTLAMSVAGAVTLANAEAAARGTDLAQALVTIREEAPPPKRIWCVHYGPRAYQNRRGGDLMVYIDEQAGAVARVVRGQ